MRNPTAEEIAPVLVNIQRHADLVAEAQLVGAQVQHAVYVLKKACCVPRNPDVVLDDTRSIWVRVIGKSENGSPITEPLVEVAQ